MSIHFPDRSGPIDRPAVGDRSFDSTASVRPGSRPDDQAIRIVWRRAPSSRDPIDAAGVRLTSRPSSSPKKDHS
ncbi:MAG: hypothetical protein CMJ27_01500 [Phycisphaerae bacterium]|nr:hypothetical protein [Phycisphaerae bacterium]OUX03141.1 MAG: hypothetical protein CBD91_00940 [Phycisphaeraceae bacterium TMED231]